MGKKWNAFKDYRNAFDICARVHIFVRKREKAMEKYRELLWLLKDEPIYLVRYE